MNAGVRIGVLKLPGESISDDEAESLLNANNSKHLQKIDFYGNKMSIRGIETFATFLKKETTIIKELDIRSKEMTSNIECNQMLLGSVNSKMRYINLGSLIKKGHVFVCDEHVGFWIFKNDALKQDLCFERSMDSLNCPWPNLFVFIHK